MTLQLKTSDGRKENIVEVVIFAFFLSKATFWE